MILFFLIFIYVIKKTSSFDWQSIDLPQSHIPYFFNVNPKLLLLCNNSYDCPYKDALNKDLCWGYEKNCIIGNSYSNPHCPGHHKGWVNTKKEQIETFFNQGDFGYVKEHIDTLKTYCSPQSETDSLLKCSENMQFCQGQNILMDFTHLNTKDPPFRYSMDVLKNGQFGGYCKLNKKLFEENSNFISPLQSWAPELRYFSSLKEGLSSDSPLCDIWMNKPVIVAKIDASVSMYHHFCDFFNLYASQHVNNSFNADTQVIIWETYPYRSNFESAWKPFTKNELWDLNHLAGKKICFKDLMLPLLPRMVFGLYYNTPIIWGCERSGLFHAFNRHMLHRLRIPLREKVDEMIHVTLLSRHTTYRKILNEEELVNALHKEKNIIVKRAEFRHSDSFFNQLKQDQWTDILVGIHGSGLTHALFLPDWGVVFELYDCGDPNCYQDLARLRGLKYISWENKNKVFPENEGKHPELGAHEKFTNYAFDSEEFVRLIRVGVKHVKQHPEWKRYLKMNIKEEL